MWFQKEEKPTKRLNLSLTESELGWVKEQAVKECTTAISIIRKSIKFYKKAQESTS